MSYWDDWFKRLRERRNFFFPEIENIINEMEKEMTKTFKEMEDVIPRNMVRTRRQPDGSIKREYGPFVYGYSVKIGPDGKPVIREFGNIKPGLSEKGKSPLKLQNQREPLIDIIEDQNNISIVAELPGVEKENIELFLSDNVFTISVNTPERKYHKKLELPAEIDEKSVKSTYKNGILETKMIKKKKKEKGTKINIE